MNDVLRKGTSALVTAALLPLVLLASCGEESPTGSTASAQSAAPPVSGQVEFSDSVDGVQAGLAFPEDWDVHRDFMDTLLIGFSPVGDDDPFAENVLVVFERRTAGATVDDYWQSANELLRITMNGYKLISATDATVGGRDAKRIVYVHQSTPSPVKVLQYIVLVGDTFFLIICSAHPPDYEEFQPIFEQIVQTFEVR